MATIGFSGGDKLEQKLRELAAQVSKASEVRVGFLEGATYPDGKSVAMVAAIQEFGAPKRNIPPRPFFRNMIKAKSDRWGDTLGNLLVQHGYDADTAMSLMGEGIKGQLQQSIKDTNDPPLSPETVAAKGFDKPLVDTGHMLNSVDYEVSE